MAVNVKCSTNRDALFRAVVASNHGRILSRIRSRHAAPWSANGKALFLRRLRTAKELLRNSSICTTRTQSLAGDVDDLQKQFDRLEDMEILKRGLLGRKNIFLVWSKVFTPLSYSTSRILNLSRIPPAFGVEMQQSS